MARPVWVELHVDDEVLSRSPERAPEAIALLRGIATLAEARGARLSFRIRAPFARLSREVGLLPTLVARGHEVGVHAHGSGLAEAAAAVAAAGVVTTITTPGLVQGGRDGRAALLRQAASLGFRRVTDHGQHRAWAYEGLLPRVEAGMVVLAPTVRPTDWGLYDAAGRRPLGEAPVRRVRELEDRAFVQHGAAFFGVALHEHDLCAPGSLQPLPGALDALAQLLDSRVSPSAEIPAPEAPPQTPSIPLPDLGVRFARAVGFSARVARRARARAWSPPPLGGGGLPVGRRHVMVERMSPEEPDAVVVVSVAGRVPGRRVQLSPFGLGIRDLTGQGLAVYLYDRAGTGRSPAAGPLSPGNPAHTEDWRAVLALARGEGVPVLALTFSSGILPVLRAAAEGDRPDALVDGEGPADRWSLIPPDGNELEALDPWNDAAWVGLEPVALLGALGVPYARLQGAVDHVHGAMTEHARRLVAAARAAGIPVHDPGVLAGALHGHPQTTLEALVWASRAGKPLDSTCGV